MYGGDKELNIGMGHIPIMFHPPGDSAGYTAVCLSAIATAPFGTVCLGVSSRGVAIFGSTSPR